VRAAAHPQIKNLLAINLLSLGTPMLLMGDEMRRTSTATTTPTARTTDQLARLERCLQRHADIHRFVRGLIKIRNCASRCATTIRSRWPS
jgi:isoamylase